MASRDHTTIKKRLAAIQQPSVQIHIAGEIHNRPFHHIIVGKSDNAHPNILLTAGMHGDEPAGVEAVLRFLEQDLRQIADQFHLTVLPCINPSGYALNTRENADGIDINRDFEEDKTAETRLVKKILKGHQFAVQFDMHEDYDATGAYFYEGRHDTQWFMPQVAEQAKKIGPLNGNEGDEGETDISISEGVYQVDPEWGQVGLVSYVLHNHADHVIMTETPSTAWPLNQRVAIHRLTLDSLLNHYANRQETP